MEMSHQGGAEAESLLRPDHRNAVVKPATRGWEAEEKAPFIRNEPVRLTPAWEGSNLPNDTLNLKGIGMDLAPPKDRWHLVYITLLVHGLGTLTAWNMFITATPYFTSFKLPDEPYKSMYLPYTGLAAQIPNLLFSWINVFVKLRGDLTTRIVWSLSMEVLIFVVTIVLAMVDSTQWPGVFLWVTLASIFVMNSCNAIFQNSVYGVAARLPSQYTGAVVLGSNVCGTLVVLAEWASSSIGGSPRTAAIYYFISGMFVLLICFDTYFALPLNRFYRYHDTLQQRTQQFNPALPSTGGRAPASTAKSSYWDVIKQSYVQLYNIWLVFFVSLAVFPDVHSHIKPVTPGFLGANFQRVTCFLTFNLMAMIGNLTASWFPYPTKRWLSVFTTARIAFIPFFLLCNYQPSDVASDVARTMPVLVNSDIAYWVGAILLGWSSGHGSSLGMMYVSGTVEPKDAATAGMLGGATLVTGITSGLIFAFIAPVRIVTAQYWLHA